MLSEFNNSNSSTWRDFENVIRYHDTITTVFFSPDSSSTLLTMRFFRCFFLDKLADKYSPGEDQTTSTEGQRRHKPVVPFRKRGLAGATGKGSSFTLTIHLYAMSNTAIDSAIRGIEELLKKSKTIKKLSSDTIVKSVMNMSAEQVIGRYVSCE